MGKRRPESFSLASCHLGFGEDAVGRKGRFSCPSRQRDRRGGGAAEHPVATAHRAGGPGSGAQQTWVSTVPREEIVITPPQGGWEHKGESVRSHRVLRLPASPDHAVFHLAVRSSGPGQPVSVTGASAGVLPSLGFLPSSTGERPSGPLGLQGTAWASAPEHLREGDAGWPGLQGMDAFLEMTAHSKARSELQLGRSMVPVWMVSGKSCVWTDGEHLDFGSSSGC